MRHRKKNPHLGRKRGHRKYMLANMGSSLIEHKSINTTLAKAKALKLFIEPIITKSKTDSTHNRRIVFKYLRNKYAVTELFREVAVKIGDRPGGYTRIIKLGNRSGDNADMAMIELVDYNELYSQSKPESRRRRRRKKKSTEKIPSELANAGDEASAVGFCMHLSDKDRIASTHRGHGHCIAKGAEVSGMMKELFGSSEGLCKGKGGSMHVADIDKGILGANGIVAGGPPISVGSALAAKIRKNGKVAVSFSGDGSVNQGT